MAVIGRERSFKKFTMLQETHLWSVDPVYGAVQLFGMEWRIEVKDVAKVRLCRIEMRNLLLFYDLVVC